MSDYKYVRQTAPYQYHYVELDHFDYYGSCSRHSKRTYLRPHENVVSTNRWMRLKGHYINPWNETPSEAPWEDHPVEFEVNLLHYNPTYEEAKINPRLFNITLGEMRHVGCKLLNNPCLEEVPHIGRFDLTLPVFDALEKQLYSDRTVYLYYTGIREDKRLLIGNVGFGTECEHLA